MESDREIVGKLELELLKSETRKDSKKLSALISDEFEEFGKAGAIYNKHEIIEALANENYMDVTVTELRSKSLSEQVILIKYRTSSNGSKANRSSLWVKNNNSWQLIHHQGTKCE